MSKKKNHQKNQQKQAEVTEAQTESQEVQTENQEQVETQEQEIQSEHQSDSPLETEEVPADATPEEPDQMHKDYKALLKSLAQNKREEGNCTALCKRFADKHRLIFHGFNHKKEPQFGVKA